MIDGIRPTKRGGLTELDEQNLGVSKPQFVIWSMRLDQMIVNKYNFWAPWDKSKLYTLFESVGVWY